MDFEYTAEDIENALDEGFERAAAIAVEFAKEFAPGFLPTLIERLK